MIRRVVIVSAVFLMVITAVSCSSTRYVIDQDSRHDFSSYSSYAWFKLAAPPDQAEPPTEANTILTRRIRWAIDGELGSKGLVEKPVGEADFLVTYSLVLQSRMVMYHTGWSAPYGCCGWGGWGWGGGWSGGRTSVSTYTDGTIVVDVLDTGTRKLVWRGIVESAFKGPNPDDEKIRKVVARVMADFPPA